MNVFKSQLEHLKGGLHVQYTHVRKQTRLLVRSNMTRIDECVLCASGGRVQARATRG